VQEAVGAFAAPSVSDEILGLALRWARRPEIPEGGEALRDFVLDSLFRAAEEVLGKGEARAIVAELTPMLESIGRQEVSEVRPSWQARAIVAAEADADPAADDDDFPEIDFEDPPLAGTPAVGTRRPRLTDPAPASMPLVLLASLDPGTVQALSSALAGYATLEPVSDALSMLEDAGGATVSILVIDCARPSVRVETVLALAPELPRGTHVVLWGERRDLQERLALLGSGMPETWVRCGEGATAMDVAAVCRILHD
jgi:hypothetical protein